jgi:hypothetical protein
MPTFGQGGADPVILPDLPPEEHRFDNLTIEDGLSQSTVFAIPQDEVDKTRLCLIKFVLAG